MCIYISTDLIIGILLGVFGTCTILYLENRVQGIIRRKEKSKEKEKPQKKEEKKESK